VLRGCPGGPFLWRIDRLVNLIETVVRNLRVSTKNPFQILSVSIISLTL
jgi:hypothetical protein